MQRTADVLSRLPSAVHSQTGGFLHKTWISASHRRSPLDYASVREPPTHPTCLQLPGPLPRGRRQIFFQQSSFTPTFIAQTDQCEMVIILMCLCWGTAPPPPLAPLGVLL